MRPVSALAALLFAVLLAPTAQAGVRLVDRIDLEQAAHDGAIGLAAPGAGPAVTRESALNTLLTGSVESSLVGGTPAGQPKLVLGGPEPPEIQVTLPPEGRTRNDHRYAITVSGRPGTVLTSDSTRIDGLVSLADVANGRLRVVEVADPVSTLERLDRRIERNASIRLPLTLALAVASILAALVAPRWAPRLVLLALAANLWLAGWWLVALVSLGVIALPLGPACAAVLAAYLAVLGLDAEAIALSPFGPSQAGRFYGLSNLLSTWLLLPALLGAALLRRARIVLAVVALVAVGGNRFGADGGGLLVLLAGYATLVWRLAGARLTAARAVALAVAVIVVGIALVGLDAALGGSSHVTSALGDGPGAVLGDIGGRLEASLRRVVAGPGPALGAFAGLAGLAFVATRRPRGAVTDAILVAVTTSLLVNDTPTDVAAVGATVAFLVHRFEREAQASRFSCRASGRPG